jgi:TonB family protein
MKRLWLLGLIFFCAFDVQAAEGFRSGKRPDLDASALSKAPKLVRKAAPEFPAAAFAQGVEAEIKLLLDLDEHGQVVGAVVVAPQEPTHLGFEEAALAAAYQLGFEPAEIEGKPVAVQVAYTFKFVPPKPAPVEAAPVIEATAPPPEPEKPVAPAPPPSKSLVGIIRERGTRTPMPGTLVTVHREDGPAPVGFEDTSDKEGRFVFFDLAPGAWQVTIEVPGYRPFHTTEEIRQGERVEATYFIERGSYNPFDVVVEAPRPRKEVTRVVIEKEIIEKVPGAMGDALTALQNYAGVARVGGFEEGIIVRGSAPSDTKVFVDGVEIPIVYHFGSLRSVLSTGMIESLQFYPGNFSPYYGRAIGGVIDVHLKKPRSDRWHGYVDVNLLDAGFFVEAPITSKLTLSAAARRSYIDTLWNALIPQDASVRVTQLPVYYDYQFLANYRPAPAHDLRLFVFGSDDAMTMVFKNSASLGADMGGNRLGNSTRFQRAMASYRYVPNDGFENTLRLSVGRDANDQVVGQFVEHLSMDSLQVRDTARLQLSNMVSLVGGVDSIVQHWKATVRMPQPPGDEGEDRDVDLTQTIDAKADEVHWLPGGFAGMELAPTPGLLLTPGLRFDYFSKIKDATLAPRLAARYALGERFTVKGGVGLYHQEPTVDQSNESFGNPRLKAERAIHYAAGAEVKAMAGISLDVTGFYKDLSNQVSPTTATRVEDGRDVALRYDNHGVGRVVGMELVLRRDPVHRLSGWVAYTLSRSERRDSGATDYRLFQYDQTHILTAVAMWRFGRNWQLSSRFRLVSGKPETPVVGAAVDLNSGEYKPTYGAKFSSRNPMFAQWDLRIDKKWVFDRFMLNLYLDVQNVTNRANVEEPDYNFDYSRKKTETGFPIYPILGVRAEM